MRVCDEGAIVPVMWVVAMVASLVETLDVKSVDVMVVKRDVW